MNKLEVFWWWWSFWWNARCFSFFFYFGELQAAESTQTNGIGNWGKEWTKHLYNRGLAQHMTEATDGLFSSLMN